MRTIKFRGKDFTGKWNYGFILKGNESAVIIPVTKNGSVMMGVNIYVTPETVGQFTGLFDKNGKEIYEGDVVRTVGYGCINSIAYQNGTWVLKNLSGWIPLMEYEGTAGVTEKFYNIEIIGNIHDNPELLKEN